jgi:hypothetical protein
LIYWKHERLKDIIGPFCYRVDSQEILLRGRIAPSCDETNNLRHRYDPRTKCGCNALYPVPLGTTFESLLYYSECAAVKTMVDMLIWSMKGRMNGTQATNSPRHLRDTVAEFALSNADEQPIPGSCFGPTTFLADIQAPYRRTNPIEIQKYVCITNCTRPMNILSSWRMLNISSPCHRMWRRIL